MRSLKKKWENSYEADVLKHDHESMQIIKKPKSYKKIMEASTISFEKIPLLSKGKQAKNEVQIDKLTTIYSRDEEGVRQPK